MKVKAHIPNALTLCNLLCGCTGIVFVLENRPVPAAWFVWGAAFFDFTDGFAARWLKVSSPLGRELDSLADVVSFGLLPSFVLYKMGQPLPFPVAYFAFSVAAFSALRLAIFNIDSSQTDSFKGMPTPANALFITSLPLLPATWIAWMGNWALFMLLCMASSALLVSRIELFALKFKKFRWQGNELRFTFLAISVLLIALLNFRAIPFIIMLYLLMSLFIRKRT